MRKSSLYLFLSSVGIQMTISKPDPVTLVLENNCSILYTEDMQEGQVLNSGLTIVNPFRA